MPTNHTSSGAPNFYVFKSRLQEYAQKEGLPTPEYETFKEGPSHEPSFKSTVIFNGVRYDSLLGFFTRKAAEQSAAEVALVELAKTGATTGNISQPVYETGLCKNLLQEYTQKMNYAIPMYECQREDLPGRVTHFKSTVEVGGMQYVGAAAKTKKEAEIKAARTALLAIKSNSSEQFNEQSGNPQLTVVPCKKRGIESVNSSGETANIPKAKKSKKARAKKKGKGPAQRQMDQGRVGENMDQSIIDNSHEVLLPSELVQNDSSGVQVKLEPVMISQNERLEINSSIGLADAAGVQLMKSRMSSSDALLLNQTDQIDSKMYVNECALGSHVDGYQSGQLAVSNAGLGSIQVTCVERQPTTLMGGENESTGNDSTMQVDSTKPAECIRAGAE